MGAKYNFKKLGYWVEFTPFVYIRISKNTDYGWLVKYEKWWWV